MTAKERAEELVYKYLPLLYGKKKYYKNSDLFKSKQCALIAVDLAIESTYFHIEFLQEVKQEIELL